MPLVVSDAGELKLLDWLFKSSGTNLTLKLYSNNYTPVAASTLANFTEATFSGYSAKTLTRATFGTPTTVSGKAVIVYPDQSWTATSSQIIYGYFVVDASNNYLFAELFPASRSLVSSDILTVSPTFTLASE